MMDATRNLCVGGPVRVASGDVASRAVGGGARGGCVERGVLQGAREKTLVSYRLAHVVPHAAFRFWATWCVMLLHGQAWSWGSERLLLVDGVCAVTR